MTTRNIHIKKHGLLILSLLITIMVTFLLISFVMIKTWENHKNTLAHQIDSLSDGFNHDISTYLWPLNSRFDLHTACDPATIKAMKQADYHAKHLTNFAIVRNNEVICTTETGVLTKTISLPAPDWITATGVKVILNLPLPLFDNGLTGRTVQAGDFLAFLDYQRAQSQTDFPWLRYINYGLVDGKQAYSYGSAGFTPKKLAELASGQQWFEDGHWMFSECRGDTECKIIAIDILEYFKEEQSSAVFIAIFLFTIMALAVIGIRHLQKWLYSLPRQVRQGLNTHQLELHYQPIIGMNSGNIEGCEVLCRWHTQEGALIRPDRFITQVENNHQTRELTELVITKCINDLRNQGLLGKCRVAINAFPDDIASGHVLKVFKNNLPLRDFSLFTVELTEQKISNLPALCEGVRQLRTVGFRVAIDDFGTGFSNLEGLRELNVDILKIDRCFIWGADTPSLKRSLVEHIVNIAKSLKLKIVAEGVETQEQLAYLRLLSVDYTQGYLHSRPLCLQDFSRLMASPAAPVTNQPDAQKM